VILVDLGAVREVWDQRVGCRDGPRRPVYGGEAFVDLGDPGVRQVSPQLGQRVRRNGHDHACSQRRQRQAQRAPAGHPANRAAAGPLARRCPWAANARIGAGTIEYWKWKDQKFGDDDQNRSRNDGSATSTHRRCQRKQSGRRRTKPIHTRVFRRGREQQLEAVDRMPDDVRHRRLPGPGTQRVVRPVPVRDPAAPARG